MSKEIRLIGTLLVVVGIALAGVAQFVPSGQIKAFGAEVNAFPWGQEAKAFGSEDSENWFDADSDDDGVKELQAQMVIGYVGLLFGLVGFFLGLGRGSAGSILSILAAVLVGVAAILFSTGIDAAYDGDMDMVAGFFLWIGGAVSMLVGGVFQRM